MTEGYTWNAAPDAYYVFLRDVMDILDEVGRSVGWLVVGFVWFACWLVWLIGWLAGPVKDGKPIYGYGDGRAARPASWLVGWLFGCLVT